MAALIENKWSSEGLPCLRRQSTMEIFDEVCDMVEASKSLAIPSVTNTNASKRKRQSRPSTSGLLSYSQAEIPAYLGKCYYSLLTESEQLSSPQLKARSNEKKAEGRYFHESFIWRIPLDSARLQGHVKKAEGPCQGRSGWNFYWDSTDAKGAEKLVLSGTKSRHGGPPCYSIMTPGSRSFPVLVARLEFNSKRNKFSLFDTGLEVERFLEVGGGDLHQAKFIIESDAEEYESPFVVRTRKELATILIKRGRSRILFWRDAEPGQLTLLLPHFNRKDKLKDSADFSKFIWNDVELISSIWEKFSGTMVKVKDGKKWSTKEKSLTLGKPAPTTHSVSKKDDGFVLSIEKVPFQRDSYKIGFGSPLSFCHAFALTLAAIETNFT